MAPGGGGGAVSGAGPGAALDPGPVLAAAAGRRYTCSGRGIVARTAVQ